MPNQVPDPSGVLATVERILLTKGQGHALTFVLCLIGIAVAWHIAIAATRKTREMIAEVREYREAKGRREFPAQDIKGHELDPRTTPDPELAALRHHVDERCEDIVRMVREEFARRDRATAEAREDNRDSLQRIERRLDDVLSRALFPGGRS